MDKISAIFLCGTPDEDTRTLIIFPAEYFDKAQHAAAKADDMYWDETNPHYYEWGWNDYVEYWLNNFKIPHSSVHMIDFEYLLPEECRDLGEIFFLNYVDYIEKQCAKFKCADNLNVYMKI